MGTISELLNTLIDENLNTISSAVKVEDTIYGIMLQDEKGLSLGCKGELKAFENDSLAAIYENGKKEKSNICSFSMNGTDKKTFSIQQMKVGDGKQDVVYLGLVTRANENTESKMG